MRANWNISISDAFRRPHWKPEGDEKRFRSIGGIPRNMSLAKQSRSAEHRQMLMNMAVTWESLANDRIRTAEGLERIAKLEKAAGRSRRPS